MKHAVVTHWTTTLRLTLHLSLWSLAALGCDSHATTATARVPDADPIATGDPHADADSGPMAEPEHAAELPTADASATPPMTPAGEPPVTQEPAPDGEEACSLIFAREIAASYRTSPDPIVGGYLLDWMCGPEANLRAEVGIPVSSVFDIGKQTPNAWLGEHCADRPAYERSSFAYHASGALAGDIQDAYRRCIVAHTSTGLSCVAFQTKASAIQVWVENPPAQDAGLTLAWTTINVEATSPLPGIVSGQVPTEASFRVLDAAMLTSLRANGTGDRPGGGLFSSSCQIIILPARTAP